MSTRLVTEAATAEIGVRELRKSFNDKKVLDGLSLAVRRGEFVSILGRSGSGKSVLLRLIVGLMQPDSGTVEVGGVNPATASPEDLERMRDRIGFLFQGAALLNSLTVFDNVALPLRERSRMSESDVRAETTARLRSVGLEGDAGKFPGQLSGGMRKRVGLARALVGKRDHFLYDEPTAGLDPIGSAQISDLILACHREAGATSILVSHDLAVVFRLSDRVAFLDGGRIYAEGTAEEIRGSDDPRVRQFLEGKATESESTE